MNERVAYASWNFISVYCGKHLCEMKLSEVSTIPFYRCEKIGCAQSFPYEVYEKIMDDVIKQINKGMLVVGGVWTVKFHGKSYECKVLAATDGKPPVIGVRCAE